MRRLLLLIGATALVCGGAEEARAKALSWQGTMVLDLGILGTLESVDTGVATVNNTSGSQHLSTLRIASAFTINSTAIPVTDPVVSGVMSQVLMQDVHIASATVTGISGGGPLGLSAIPVPGLARLCFFGCGLTLPLDFTQNAGNTGIGIGGLITVGGNGGVRMSIDANPWTIGTGMAVQQTGNGSFVSVTRAGTAHGPASATSTTAARLGSGVIQLITPMQMVSSGLPGATEKMALFGTLTLQFIPEPGLLLLLGTGAVGLALLGRSRIRR